MTPNYHEFILGALRESAPQYTNNNILICALQMVKDIDNFNDWIEVLVDSTPPESAGEVFHKYFRQQDVTGDGKLDMLMWHAMQGKTNIHKLVKFIVLHPDRFQDTTMLRMVDDYMWDDSSL